VGARAVHREVGGGERLACVDERDGGRPRRRRGGRVTHHDRDPGRGRLDQALDLDRGRLAVHRHRAGAEPPHREELGKELEAVAAVEEDAVARAETETLVAGTPGSDLAGGRRRVPLTPGQRLDQPTDRQHTHRSPA
jgi:hypothetical protein